MVADTYESILEEVGRQLNVALAPDQNNTCLIQMPEGIELQLEVDDRSATFLISYAIGSPPPGRYRANLLKEALIANGLPGRQKGSLGFSHKTQTLYLYEALELDNLRGATVAEQVLALKSKALLWANAIKNGEMPLIEGMPTPSSGGMMGLFGMRP